MTQFQDYTGSDSNGRIIGFIVVTTALLILVAAMVLAFVEALYKTGTGYGIIIIGSMVGLISSTMVYLGYHKTQETKCELGQGDTSVGPVATDKE